MASQDRILRFLLRLGLFIYPSSVILDCFFYPEYFLELAAIRVGITLFIFLVYITIFRVGEQYYFPFLLSTFCVASLGMSLMCYVTGDGFKSPYFVGLAQTIVGTTVLFHLKPRNVILINTIVLAQHFFLLVFLPWNYMDLLNNVFSLGIMVIISVMIHRFIYSLAKENREIRGILPICASCKKIRNDQGGWEQIENYIRERSKAEFSHGICPECAKKLYPEFI
jgi:hypothetical protein